MSTKRDTTDNRISAFARNRDLEALLTDLNANLWPAEALLMDEQEESPHPVLLIMGPMRSGTTLFMQWLANSGLVAYPTNLLSRFYQAPIIGAKIQRLLTDPDYNFRDELGEFIQQAEYVSENGKTRGVLAPNEFWYFWRRFLKDPEQGLWSDDELHATMDVETMKAELFGMMSVFDKPFAAKAMMFNFNIGFFDGLLDKVVFVHLKRDLENNIESVLDARRRQYGNEDEWYSFLVPEYDKLVTLDNREQVKGQIESMHRGISTALEMVAPERQLIVHYEDFCSDPRQFHDQLVELLNLDPRPYTGVEKFTITRR